MFQNIRSRNLGDCVVSRLTDGDVSYIFCMDQDGYDAQMRVRNDSGVAGPVTIESVDWVPLTENQRIIALLLTHG